MSAGEVELEVLADAYLGYRSPLEHLHPEEVTAPRTESPTGWLDNKRPYRTSDWIRRRWS
jgi:hypothetical protein